MMMLDILDNLPRLRMSSNLFRMVLWVLKESGLSNVPSYEALRKLQADLRKRCGTEPTECKSSLGNIFYVNDIPETVARVRFITIFSSIIKVLSPTGFCKPTNYTSHAFLSRRDSGTHF
jgi:hypothetical protein